MAIVKRQEEEERDKKQASYDAGNVADLARGLAEANKALDRLLHWCYRTILEEHASMKREASNPLARELAERAAEVTERLLSETILGYLEAYFRKERETKDDPWEEEKAS